MMLRHTATGARYRLLGENVELGIVYLEDHTGKTIVTSRANVDTNYTRD